MKKILLVLSLVLASLSFGRDSEALTTTPITPLLAQAEFNAVHSMTYNGWGVFQSGTTWYGFYVDSGASNTFTWGVATMGSGFFPDTGVNANKHPWTYVPTTEGDILNLGTYNTSDNTVTRNGHKYKFAFERYEYNGYGNKMIAVCVASC